MMKESLAVKKENFEFSKANGQKIRGLICRPDDDNKKYPCVIFSHGFGGCYAELKHHGDGYAENGIVCVFFDFCGGGLKSTSDGNMSEMTILTEAEDLDTVMSGVIALPYVDKDLLYIQGESQGGMVSTMVAAKRQDEIKAMILWYPAFVIPDDAAERLRSGKSEIFGQTVSEEYNKAAVSVNPAELESAFKKPVLLIHGDKDPVVPITYSEEALKRFTDARLEVIKNAGHGFDGADSIHARELSIAFIKEN